MRTALTFTVLLVVGLTVAPAAVVAREDPTFEVTVPEPVLTPGQSTQLTLLVTNDAELVDEQVRTAENVKVELRSGDTPITVRSGPRSLGRMADGATREVAFGVSVPRDIGSGTHDLSLTVTFELDDELETRSVDVPVRVEDRARFEVVDATANVSVGNTGTYELTVRNVGSEIASAATMQLESRSGDVTLGQTSADARVIGTLAPGEVTTAAYTVSVAESAAPQRYALAATVSYEDESGIDRSAPSAMVELMPAPEQSFSVPTVNASLRVGEEGTLRGQLVNTGDIPVRNVVLALQPSSPTVNAVEPEFAVGDLGAGERAEFSFPLDISESADAGPRQLSVEVRHRDANGDVQQSDPLDLRVEVAPKRDTFAVEPVRTTLAAGSGDTIALRVANQGEEPVADVSAKLFARDPLSTTDDEVFVDSLAPGESAVVVFGLRANGDALTKVYPVSIDFQYDDASGDTKVSDTYKVPVQIREPTGGGGLPRSPVVIGAVVIVVLLLGGGYYQYRRP